MVMEPISGAAAAVGGMAEKAIKNKLDDGHKTDKMLIDLAKKSGDLDAAATVRAHKEFYKQMVWYRVWQPIGKMVGLNQDYFQEILQDRIADKLGNVPKEDIIIPRGSVAGPALEGVGLTVGEPELQDMYLNLLAAAADRRSEQRAHPSFAQIIGQINCDEAKYLADVLNCVVSPIIEIQIVLDASTPTVKVYQTNIPAWAAKKGRSIATLPDDWLSYVNNWERLGVVHLDWSRWVNGDLMYSWADRHPSVVQARAEFGDNVIVKRGSMRVTNYGKQFFEVVIAPSIDKASDVVSDEVESGE